MTPHFFFFGFNRLNSTFCKRPVRIDKKKAYNPVVGFCFQQSSGKNPGSHNKLLILAFSHHSFSMCYFYIGVVRVLSTPNDSLRSYQSFCQKSIDRSSLKKYFFILLSLKMSGLRFEITSYASVSQQSSHKTTEASKSLNRNFELIIAERQNFNAFIMDCVYLVFF